MATRLMVVSRSPAARAAPSTMADQIDRAIDELCRLRQIAGNERRGHSLTEQLIDGLYVTGRAISRIGRG